ncbi:MAG: nuoL, partial [Dehalococcoidia bacterium]|nr:nuoL [Dehalococcoidia bacterium]
MVVGMGHAWLIPVLSLVAFLIIGVATLLGRDRLLPGRGAYLSISAIAAGFILFWYVLGDLLANGPAGFGFVWLQIGRYALQWSMHLDPLSVSMVGLVTLVALCVQVYSLGYMAGHPRFGWYYGAHALFTASMLGLVLSDNFLLLYITWELVGLCSYLLIGFYYERRSAAEAAKKAFITTRLGDVGLLIGILLLFKATGTFNMADIMRAAEAGEIAPAIITWAAVLIFLGAMGKSAQFPFHVWLPDAMEGPSPVSALIHAATMVAAGVYLVARTYPLFVAAPGVLFAISIIGLITALLAASIALVTNDIKRVLAYSTVSKLGFMMLALGSGGYGAAMFYLITHGFFKALLFLGAGSVIHSTEKQDMWELGGLWRKMPITTITFTIGALALAGLPPLSGFWSKDEVLTAVRDHQHPIVYILALLVVFMTAVFIARVTLVTFFGQPRSDLSHTHEAPWVMNLPILALAGLSVVSGLVAFPFFGGFLAGSLEGTEAYTLLEAGHQFHFDMGMAAVSTSVSVAGLLVGGAFYWWRVWSAEALAQRFAPLYTL